MNKKTYNNSDSKTTASKGVKPKGKSNSDVSECTQGKNSKGGNKGQKQNFNQNSSDQKSNQKSTQNSNQNSKPNAKKGRYCTNCETKTHDTKYCWHLKKDKSQQKQINKLDDSNASNDSQEDQDHDFGFGHFNALCAVDHKSPVIDSFATKLASHPLATTESLMTKLNIEGICHLNMEVDTAASHNIISERAFDALQDQL